MGAYLSKPICDKESEDHASDLMRVGASAMQGWRMSQEDAHCCILDFDTNTSLFAVYDGHGGSEVAKYTASRFPDFLKAVPSYREGQLAAALEDAFLGFDATLITDDVKQQLVVLAAGGEPIEDEKDNEEDAAETAMLCEEATMPIEKLLERYGGPAVVINRAISDIKKPDGKNLSPVIRPKHDRQAAATSGSPESSNMMTPPLNSEEKEVNEKEIYPTDETGDEAVACVVKLADKLVNGCCDSDGNDNSNNMPVDSQTADCKADMEDSSKVSSSLANGDSKTMINTEKTFPGDFAVGDPKESGGSSEKLSLPTVDGVADGTGDALAKSDSEQVDGARLSKTVVVAVALEGSSSVAGSGDNEAEASGSGAGCSSSAAQDSMVGCSSSSAGPSSGSKLTESSDEEEDTTDDDDDTDSEDAWNADQAESDSDDGDDEDDDDDDELGKDAEDDDDEDEDDDAEELDPGMGFGEEPGADSGCTAVVALLRDSELHVANAGDSRCVLCHAGKAVEMSIDHKPEDTIEQDRILKAGGRVTCDGRVNGGLNLSRAIGDHTYKKNAAISDREQMITALPDVKSVKLDEAHEFMVLACDGIWNVMSSQDVVDFVRNRIQTGTTKLSAICEEMFDFCLAPDTSGDGTGCDNMTCVIVSFKGLTSCVASRTGGKRKAADDVDAAEDVTAVEEAVAAKRPKGGD